MEPELPACGPFPVGDLLGMGVAVAILLKSQEKGRYAASQQFEKLRKLRAAFSNSYMASVEGVSSLRTVGAERAKHHLTHSPTQSQWFERFSQGRVRRMGQEVHQDWANPLPAMHALMRILDREWMEAQGKMLQEQIASLGASALIAFCRSFWGSEVFLTNLNGLPRHFKELEEAQSLKRDHIVIPLLGHFKGEQNSRFYLAPLASKTSSGLKVKVWVMRLLEVREQGTLGDQPSAMKKEKFLDCIGTNPAL
jgi:hypothetical protein